jgi:hypothetical protein
MLDEIDITSDSQNNKIMRGGIFLENDSFSMMEYDLLKEFHDKIIVIT